MTSAAESSTAFLMKLFRKVKLNAYARGRDNGKIFLDAPKVLTFYR